MKATKLFKTILSLLMVLALLVACAPAAENNDNPGDKNDPAQYEGLEKEEYLQQLGENNLGAAIDSFGTVYGQSLEGLKKGDAASTAVGGAKLDMTLNVGKDLLDMLEQAIAGVNDPEIDFYFLSKINLGLDMGMGSDAQKMQLTLGLNDQKIITLNMLMNMAESIAYVAVPELNDSWIKFDAGAAMPEGSASGMMSSAATMGVLAKALPDAETLTRVLNRYLDLILPELKNVEQSTETLEVAGVKQECTKLTLKIYEADALAIAKAVLNAAKDDDDLKKIIEDGAKAIQEMTGEDIGANNAYDDFKEAVTDMLADLNGTTATDTEHPITLATYVDKNHNVIGGMLKMSTQDSNRGTFYVYSITEGDKTAFEAAIPSDVDDTDDFKISGSSTKKDGKTNGTYKLTFSGKEYISLELEDLTDESGTITIKPTETMIYDMGLNALPFKDLSVQIKLAGENAELNVLSEGKLLIGLALKASESAGPDLSEPSNAVDAMDSAAMQSWAESLNIQSVLDKLEAAGIPGALIEGFISGLNGSAGQAQPDYSYAA